MKSEMEQIGLKGRAAAHAAANLSTSVKNRALRRMAVELLRHSRSILRENGRDLAEARKKRLKESLIDRLQLTAERIRGMAEGLRQVASLPDPVGAVTRSGTRPNGLKVSRVRIPLGLIAVVYESRPNVTVEAAGLCLKAGNAVILRGGSEAFHSNQILVTLFRRVLKQEKVSPDLIQGLPTPDRKALARLVTLDQYIDLLIPRGGEGLMRWIRNHAKVPVIRHDKGVCHTYVDRVADLKMATRICFNAKVQRPGVCNAMETLLVHQKIAPRFLPEMIRRYREAGVEIRGCPVTRHLAPGVKPASAKDWGTEFLDKILAVRVVDDLDGALSHISRYGSQHTEAIVTRDRKAAERFLREVPSSLVLHNASTRFNDGGELGLGAEIGISTTKLHAFGPMGLEELTATKFVARGKGQIRE